MKWQTENLVLQVPVFVHRDQIKHAKVGQGAARELNESHANEIMYGRVSDPYGDFSPLLLTILKDDNPTLEWKYPKKLKKHVTSLLQEESVEILGGVEEKVVNSTLVFRVFGHQHLFQVNLHSLSQPLIYNWWNTHIGYSIDSTFVFLHVHISGFLRRLRSAQR